MNIYEVVRQPLISERSLAQAERGVYTFVVDKKAAKKEITAAVEKMFGVKALAIRTSLLPGKTKRLGRGRKTYQRPAVKKAFVTVEKGQKIDLFEVSGKKE